MNRHRSGYSITSSARASSEVGTSMPSAFAVLRLIDHLILGRRLDRQVSWLLTLEDAIDVARGSAMWIDCVGPICEETAGAREIAEWIDRGQTVAGSKRNNQLAMRAHRRTNGQNDQTDIRRRRERIQGALDFTGLTHVDRDSIRSRARRRPTACQRTARSPSRWMDRVAPPRAGVVALPL